MRASHDATLLTMTGRLLHRQKTDRKGGNEAEGKNGKQEYENVVGLVNKESDSSRPPRAHGLHIVAILICSVMYIIIVIVSYV